MLGIMRKDAPIYLLMAAFAVLGPALDAVLHGLRGNSAVTTGGWTLLLALPAVQCEVAEYCTRGYRFLRPLPLTAREIVWAKHLWPVVLVVGQQIYVTLLFAAVAPREVRLASRSYSLLAGNLTLVVAAVLLFIVFRFGLSRGSMVALILATVAGMVALQEVVIRHRLLQDIARFGSWPVLAGVTLVCLGVYALLATASVRAFERREV